MLESRSFRFTPARLVLFLLTPAMLLGGTFAVAQRSLVVGLVVLALGAVTIAVNLGVGALMTGLGMRWRSCSGGSRLAGEVLTSGRAIRASLAAVTTAWSKLGA